MIHLQVQASDVWDMQILQEHLKRMKKIILLILDDDSATTASSPCPASIPTQRFEYELPSESKMSDVTIIDDGIGESSNSDMSKITINATSSLNITGDVTKVLNATHTSEGLRSLITSTNEIPYPGYHLTPTIHHDTYSSIDPLTANFCGKVVLVTGASRGIGRSIAISFAKAGATGIVIAARTAGDLNTVKSDILRTSKEFNRSTRVLAVFLDLLDETSVQQMASQIQEEFGRLDVIVNNAAAIDHPLPLSSNDIGDWWTPFTINVRGTHSVTCTLLPLLRSSDAGAKVVINIVSSNALTATAYCSGYGVSSLVTF